MHSEHPNNPVDLVTIQLPRGTLDALTEAIARTNAPVPLVAEPAPPAAVRNDPQVVQDVAAYTKKLAYIRGGYDKYIATINGNAPKLGMVFHHLLIATGIWSAFTCLPGLGVVGAAGAYLVPAILYVPLQCFNPKFGERAEDHHGHHHHHSSHNNAKDFTKTHPTAAALGGLIGGMLVALLYSPLIQNTEFMLYTNAYVKVLLEGALRHYSVTVTQVASAACSIMTTAAIGATVVYLSQALAAAVYDHIYDNHINPTR